MVFSLFGHALEISTIAMPKSHPMNGTTSVTMAATSSLPVGRCSASGDGLRRLNDLLRRPERSNTLRQIPSTESRNRASFLAKSSASRPASVIS